MGGRELELELENLSTVRREWVLSLNVGSVTDFVRGGGAAVTDARVRHTDLCERVLIVRITLVGDFLLAWLGLAA